MVILKKIVKNNATGYVCVVDINVLSMTFIDPHYHEIVKNATFNTCDGSFGAIKKHKIQRSENYYSYNGPEIFKKYIVRSDIKQLLIGPNNDDFDLLKRSIPKNNHLFNLELPYKEVEEFNYTEIAEEVNRD